jgi:Carboxylesterase family
MIRFPVIDNDILTDNLEELIRNEPLVNVDILIGVTADESLYFADEHLFNHYLPKKYRRNSSSIKMTTQINSSNIISFEQTRGFSYFKKNKYIKNYLQTNYPKHFCFYDEIQARYMPEKIHQHNLTSIAQHYTDLIRLLINIY